MSFEKSHHNRFIFAVTALTSQIANADEELLVSKVAPRSATQIAIVPFAGAKGVSDITQSYLTSIGQLAGSDSLPELPTSSKQVHLELWQARQLPYLVVGNSNTNRGDVEINFEVIDVKTGRVLGGVQKERAKITHRAYALPVPKLRIKF